MLLFVHILSTKVLSKQSKHDNIPTSKSARISSTVILPSLLRSALLQSQRHFTNNFYCLIKTYLKASSSSLFLFSPSLGW